MNRIVKRVLAWLLAVVLIAASVAVCSVICNHPSEETENTVASFYREPAGSLDAVMIGSSACGKDFYPHVLWREEKITSYCMCVAACSGNIYSSVLTEVLSAQPQAVILVDADGFLVEDKFQTETDPIRIWLDAMPRNENRLQTIRALTPDDLPERLFPFYRYHRYMNSLYAYIPVTVRLLEKKLHNVRDPMKGATLNPSPTIAALQTLDVSALQAQPLSAESERVFQAFLEYCKEKELTNVVFVDLPKAYATDEQYERNLLYGARMQTIRSRAQEYGYAAVSYNALQNPAQLDVRTDYADTLHLTTQGAPKFSAWFAAYLQDAYGFSEKDEALAAQWDAYTQGVLR